MAKPINKVPVSSGVNKWDEELAGFASEASAKETVGGSFLSFKSGMLSFGGNAIKGNSLDVVVLGDVHENAYYDQPYDADNPVSPACFAFGEDANAMAPHADAKDPQAERCSTCKWNQFGSADNGKGKKCRNIRKVALIPSDQLADIAGAEMAFAKIPPTSVVNFQTHTKRVTDAAHRPLWAAITSISCAPHLKKQVEVSFAYVDSITDGEQLGALKALHLGIQATLQVPYTYAEATPAPQTASSSKVRGKR